jgi:hypothetical protein
MVMSKLAESIECVQIPDATPSQLVIVSGMPFSFRAFVLFSTGLLRSEGKSIYDKSTLDDIRALWEALEYKYEPREQNWAKKATASGWRPSPEYLEKLPDNKMIDTILLVIRGMAKKIAGDEEDDKDPIGSLFNYNYRAVDYKPLMQAVYDKLIEY